MVHKKTHLMIDKGLQQFLTARWVSDVSVEASSMHGGFTKYPSVGTGLSSAQYCSQGIQQKYLAAAYISQIHDGSVICVRMKQLTTIGLQHSDKIMGNDTASRQMAYQEVLGTLQAVGLDLAREADTQNWGMVSQIVAVVLVHALAKVHGHLG
ncbi:hypothetical protein N7516_002590 [Penicillium verrucosum]|uniref:uncharacterized protein n=1 Tax=Penicillium verrucosum TaxID=60171 RepID=UPI002545854A|nr:uncharacterized protein N7516_002590 [Penicillium verrucosum]KAJ5942422.1 hypothetical protein N7516_002590 [Penicillium verrucosum]